MGPVGIMILFKNMYKDASNKAVQTEPVTCSFQARSGQEFAAECGDEPSSRHAYTVG